MNRADVLISFSLIRNYALPIPLAPSEDRAIALLFNRIYGLLPIYF